MSTTRLLFVHARSPLHAGTGQSTAAVDLPVARDRATEMPLLPGSSLKGALRARARMMLPDIYTEIFGPETDNARDHAGAVSFTDASLLLLPVRSVAGTFAWVTSPWLLARLQREAVLAGIAFPAPPMLPLQQAAMVTRDTLLTSRVGDRDKVILEDFDLDVDPNADQIAKAIAALVFEGDDLWADLLRRRLCIVHDDVMSFLGRHATEIVTRVSIDHETGTAKDGQLWTEENLPAETVLFGLAEELPNGRSKRPGQWLDQITELVTRPIQLGGKATVGRGRCQISLAGGAR